MRPVAITLNYSVENIRNDIHQKIIPIRLTGVGLAHARPNYEYFAVLGLKDKGWGEERMGGNDYMY